MDALLEKWQVLQAEFQTLFSQMPNPLTMDWQALHFLRPDWFYGFLPLAFLILVLLKKFQNQQSWKKVCDAQLLPHILTTQQGKKSYLPVLITFIAASLCLTALAGPVLKELPQPVFREQSALVVLLDLSQSMNAQDIKPSRIERAKLELLDILARRRGGQSALIVYAADAFTVTPLTDDNATIANLIPSLEPSMMPAQGSNLGIALNKAQNLFTQSGLTFGDILIISDDIHSSYNRTIKQVAANGFRVSIFAIGTAQGSPIPLSNGFLKDKNGAIVIPKLDSQKLQRMALSGHGLYVNIDAGEQDTISLTDLFQSSVLNKNEDNKTNTTDNLQSNIHADVWQEEGVWLLFPLLFFAALWARKGWLVLIIALIILPDATPVYADESTDSTNVLNNLWLTPNQEAMQAFKNGEHKKAADEFNNTNWKASALYRNGDFEQAAKLFDHTTNSDNFYNKGNALAKTGLYKEAITAYEKAIELNAGNKDAAYNKDLVEDALKKQQKEENKKDKSDEKDGDTNDDKNNEKKDQQEGDNSKEKDGEQKESDKDDSEQQDKQDSQSQNDSDSDENKDQQKKSQQSSADEKKSENDSAQQSDTEKQNEQENEQQNDALKQRNPDDQNSKDKQQEQEQLKQEDLKKEDDASKNKSDEKSDEQEKNQPSQVQEINPREASVTEDQQAIEQWLRRIKDDPGGLLRRKFLYQYKNVPNQKDSDQPW